MRALYLPDLDTLRRRKELQRVMSAYGWPESLQDLIFYRDVISVDDIFKSISIRGQKKTRLYLERQFLRKGKYMDLDQYLRLKRAADKAKTDIDRAKGALDLQMTRLKSEFKCSSLEEATSLLEDLKLKRDKIETEYQENLSSFEEKWGEKI